MTDTQPTTQRLGRLGLLAYVRILSIVRDHGPMTHMQVADQFGRADSKMRNIMVAMVRARLLHISAWAEQPHTRGCVPPVFAYGPGVNAIYPRRTGHKIQGATIGLTQRNRRPTIEALGKIFDLLKDGATRAEILDSTGLMHHNLAPVLRLLKGLGMIHVAGYRRRDESSTGSPAQVFQLGDRRDAQRPPRISEAERNAAWRQRRTARASQLGILFALAGQSSRAHSAVPA